MVRIPIPGDPDGAEVLARVPDLAQLALEGWLPVPLLYAAMATIGQGGEQPRWIRPDEETERADRVARLDQWVVVATVAPRIVLHAAETSAEALYVGEVSYGLKWAIWQATYEPFVAQLQRQARAIEDFVLDGGLAGSLDLAARRYGERPSALIGLTDPRTALDFDLAIAVRSRWAEQQPVTQ